MGKSIQILQWSQVTVIELVALEVAVLVLTELVVIDVEWMLQ
jgi:hypothetical protein